MGVNWSEYSTTEMLPVGTDSCFICYICGKQKNELRVQSLACNHVSCVECLATSSFLGSGLLKDVHHDTVISYYPPTKGFFKVPGLCSVCFVENAIKSPNFHESSFYFKRSRTSMESGTSNSSNSDTTNTKII